MSFLARALGQNGNSILLFSFSGIHSKLGGDGVQIRELSLWGIGSSERATASTTGKVEFYYGSFRRKIFVRRSIARRSRAISLFRLSKVFEEKVCEQARHMAWVSAVVYFDERQRDVCWLMNTMLRTFERSAATSGKGTLTGQFGLWSHSQPLSILFSPP